MPTYTTNLGLKVPTVGSDTNDWGDYLNSDLSYLDNIFEVSGTSISLLIGNQSINTPTATGQTTFTLDQIRLKDDRTIEFGTGVDYWMRYTDTGTRFEFTSTNVNPAGDDGVIFYVVDGTDDAIFTGEVEASQLLGLTVKLKDAAGGEYVGLDAPSTVSGTYTLTFPAAVGAVDQVLSLNNIDGTLQWATPEVGDITSIVAGTGMTGTDLDGPIPTLNVIGTADRITANANDIDIASTYVGQDSITTLGTIGTGQWQGTEIGLGYGGTELVGETDGKIVVADGSGAPVHLDIGSSTAITILGTVATGQWSATTIAVDKGGTGLTSYTAGDILYASGATTLTKLAKGSDTEILTLASGVPTWAAPATAGDITSVNNATNGGLTVTNPTGGDVTLALNFGDLSTATVKVDDDQLAFFDASGGGGGGSTNKVTIAALMTAVAGDGITATDGELSADTVAAAAGTLTGTTLASNVVTSSLTTVGTITSGIWRGGTVTTAYGGVGQTGYTAGDILYASDATTLAKLAKGTDTHVLTMASGIPSWAAPATAAAAAGTLTGATLASNVLTSSLTTVGALATGSIASGFGSISTTSTIATTGTLRGTSIFLASQGDKFYFSDDATDNTYMRESAADVVTLTTEGMDSFRFASNGGNPYIRLEAGNTGVGAIQYYENDGGSGQVLIFQAGIRGADNKYYIGSNATIHTNYAIQCDGEDVAVGGELTAGTKTFRIPHPLPSMNTTHTLSHACIEGPRADLVYRDSVVLSGGSASVDLDESAGMTDGTWEALCRDPQVFLQNDTGWSALKGSVSGSTLIISCEDTNSTDTVSWMVVAERDDPTYLASKTTDDDGLLIIEAEKPEDVEDGS